MTGGSGRPNIGPRWPSAQRRLRRAAATYLIEDGLTVGWSLPRAAAEPAESLPPRVPLIPPDGLPDGRRVRPPSRSRPGCRNGRSRRSALPLAVPAGISRLADYRPRRIVLDNGLRLVYERPAGHRRRRAGALCQRRERPRVQTGPRRADRSAAGGRDDEPHRRGLAQAIEDVGGSLEVGVDGGLGPGPVRGPGDGYGGPGRRDAASGLPARRDPPDLAPHRRRAARGPGRPGLPGRPEFPRPDLRRRTRSAGTLAAGSATWPG